MTSTAEPSNTDLDWLIRASGIEPRLLTIVTDRALLIRLFTPEQVEKLSSVPVFTASEMLLWVEGSDAYAMSKQAFGTVRRELAAPLDDAQKQARRDTLCEVLAVSNLDLQIHEIAMHRNIRFVIDNKLQYSDL